MYCKTCYPKSHIVWTFINLLTCWFSNGINIEFAHLLWNPIKACHVIGTCVLENGNSKVTRNIGGCLDLASSLNPVVKVLEGAWHFVEIMFHNFLHSANGISFPSACRIWFRFKIHDHEILPPMHSKFRRCSFLWLIAGKNFWNQTGNVSVGFLL